MSSTLKEKRVLLYTLILEQLIYDDFESVAEKLSKTTLIPIDPEWALKKQIDKTSEEEREKKRVLEAAFNQSNKKKRNKKVKLENEKREKYKPRLGQLVNLGLAHENQNSNQLVAQVPPVYEDIPPPKGLNLDLELQTGAPPRKFTNYTTQFITTHKNEVKCARFSPDGTMVATGSLDTSVKLLNVRQMKKNGKTHPFDKNENKNINEKSESKNENKVEKSNTVKTFYDHVGAIVDVDFHPSAPILVSGSLDCTIRFYDWRDDSKRSFKFITETSPVKTINFHPSGETLLVGTQHNMIRIYDVATWKPLTPSSDHHIGSINEASFSPQGNMYGTCATDGTIKIWDSFSNKVIRSFQKSHLGFDTTSIEFSKNQKYLLSSGLDGALRIWDLGSGREIQTINLPNPKASHSKKSCWTWNEDFIVTSEENSCLLYDTRNGEFIQKLTGHLNSINYVASSPVEACLMTCSSDFRGRFWTDDH